MFQLDTLFVRLLKIANMPTINYNNYLLSTKDSSFLIPSQISHFMLTYSIIYH